MSARELYLWMGGDHWMWGFPVMLLAVAALYYLSLLSPPTTKTGTLARVLMLLGCALYIAAFAYSAMGYSRTMFGRMASYCLMSGVVLLVRQIALACIVERKRTAPSHPTFGHRVLAALVETDRE